ncbi:MAG: hypothetical protein OXN96_19205 [Bryobacterales bacterium]|nr:hypothetical protein [Bryobacterales bacterium]
MNAAIRARREALKAETAEAVAILERRGTCWTDWARQRGLPLHAVKDICRGRGPGLRGDNARAAALMRSEAGVGRRKAITLADFVRRPGEAV